MKFTANRKILLAHLKSMVHIVPHNHPDKELEGFLIEANEDDGYLYMTATNNIISIQRKFKHVVESGGSFVLMAKLLVDILNVLDGEDVEFKEIRKGVITVKSGACVYTMYVLDTERYPRPDIPFPDSTMRISHLKQAYKKTCSTVAKTGDSDVLKGIHVDVFNNKMRVISCNNQNIAVATNEMDCGGEASFTLTKENFAHLATAAGDDEMEMGLCGDAVVFMKDGVLISVRRLAKEYVKVDMIFDSLTTDYVATVKCDDLKNQILSTCDIATLGSETSYIKFDFGDDNIVMSTQNNTGTASNTVNVVKTKGVGDKSYYYHAQALRDFFKTVEGTVVIRLDKKGFFVIMDRYNQYLMMPIPQIAVDKQLNKFTEIKVNGKKPKQAKSEKKAA